MKSFVVLLLALLCVLTPVHGYATCGNGVVDSWETCDTALTPCCNSSCTGVYELTEIYFPAPTCFDGEQNYAQLVPMITVDPGFTFNWIFETTPAGSSPIITNPNQQSTLFEFNSNGLYGLIVQIVTASCGTYYTDIFYFTIDDCCGNGVIDVAETCDIAIVDNGCCDPQYCVVAPVDTPCAGEILDQCTTQTTCDSSGQCSSAQNRPYNLTSVGSQSIVDTTCSSDIRTFTLTAQIDDRQDNTPGDYHWFAQIIGAAEIIYATVMTPQGTVVGPLATISFTVREVGGGNFSVWLSVLDPCGLERNLLYNISRQCCGNGIINTGEACDILGSPYCSSDCTQITGYCGDAVVQPNELCDYKLNACCATTCQSILSGGTLCRATRGDCDNPEYCTGMSSNCPVDAFKPPTTICRTPLGNCDAPETCTGYDAACPNNNLPFPAGTLCLNSSGVCQNPRYCDGSSFVCPSVSTYRNDTCRDPAGIMAEPQYCIAGNPNCPPAPNITCPEDPVDCTGGDPMCGLPCGCEDPSIVCACFSVDEIDPFNQCRFCNEEGDWQNVEDGYPCQTLTPVGACSTQDVCISGVCVDQYHNSNYTCRPPVGSCDAPEKCYGDSDLCPQDKFLNSTTLCRVADLPCDVSETCSGAGPYCPSDRVQSNTTICRPIAGGCDLPEMCDGVNKACPMDLFKDSRTMCRGSNGECDSPEYCTGNNATCPIDTHYGEEMICRAPKAACDQEERCTGTGINCPPDLYADASRMCRPPDGLCDKPEYCTGTSMYCPYDALKPQGDLCRQIKGECDKPEYCTGGSKQCPKDEVMKAGQVCRLARGDCDKQEICDGVSYACPIDEVHGPTFICRLAKGGCDFAEYCIFGNETCPADTFRPLGYVCRDQVDFCDEEEQCTGDDPLCPPDDKKPAGTPCRNATDVCDRTEVCTGVDNACPENALEPKTTICRPANGTCDLPEYCTGQNAGCPENDFAPITTVCRKPQGSCDRPEYCLEGGVCPAEDLLYGDDYICHQEQSQCDSTVYCTGESTSCPYDPSDIIGAACQITGLQCRLDTCQSLNNCVAGPNTNCQCSINSQCTTTDTCLVGYCANNYCQRTIAPGSCFIDGQYFASGDHNPYNLCQVCKPFISPQMWMPATAGTSCDTGNQQGDCSAQDTCNANGVCVDRYNVGQICRGSEGTCDIVEQCVQGNDWCPDDSYKSAGVTCRNSKGGCDLEEQCTGTSPYCPSDQLYGPNHICRAPSAGCDEPEYCDGEDPECPRDIQKPAGTICREPVSGCDMEERCDGVSSRCPADRVQPANWVCRPPTNLCDKPELCNGVSNQCPNDQLYPNGTICRYPRDLCDRAEVCNGLTDVCPPDALAAAGDLCRLSLGNCDTSEFCDGISWMCPPDLVKYAGEVCRHSVDQCDSPEKCDGVNPLCPDDVYYPSTHICRGARNQCDISDHCTGFDVGCPYDALRPDGYPCSDNTFCNGDEYCISGLCHQANSLRNCSRPRSCLKDTCEESIEQCIHSQLPNIGQPCYTGPNGTIGVGICKAGKYTCDGNSGIMCSGEVTPKPFDFCGNDKDDNCDGVVDDGCWIGPCTTDEECINSPIDTCHTGRCSNASKCKYDLTPNFCFIDDRCYGFDDYRRHDPCQRCFPNISTSIWTQTNQANVSDNNICNGGEYCMNGKIYVDPPPLHCHKLSGPCTTGVCDPAHGCYKENKQDGTACKVPGSTCSVDFMCSAGTCTCYGEQQKDSTDTGLIVGLVVGGSVFCALVVVIWTIAQLHRPPKHQKPQHIQAHLRYNHEYSGKYS